MNINVFIQNDKINMMTINMCMCTMQMYICTAQLNKVSYHAGTQP